MVALAKSSFGHDDPIGAWPVRRSAGALSGPTWHPVNSTVGVATAQAAQFVGWHGHASASAHVEAFVCQPFASVQ